MLNHLTFNQLDYQCLKLAGGLSDNDIHPDVRRAYINSKLMKIYGVLDGVNDPFYTRSVTLTLSVDQEFLDETGIVAIDSTLKTIERVSGSYTIGAVIVVSVYDTVALSWDKWIGRITSTGQTASYEVLSGTDIDFNVTTTSLVLMVARLNLMSQQIVSVSGIYFKNFLTIYDDRLTSTAGRLRTFDEIKDPKVFFNKSLDAMASKRIAWYQQGDTIMFYTGENAIQMGATVTGIYRGKPAIFTAINGTSPIDFPPELNQALVDEIAASYLTDVSKPIPADIQLRLDSYEKKVYSASEANKVGLAEKENK